MTAVHRPGLGFALAGIALLGACGRSGPPLDGTGPQTAPGPSPVASASTQTAPEAERATPAADTPTPPAGPEPEPVALDLAACQALGLRHHPALASAALARRAGRAGVGVAEAARYPRLDLRGTLAYGEDADVSQNRFPGTALTAGVDLVGRYTLYDSGVRSADIDAARARVGGLDAAWQARRDAVLVTISEAYANAVTAAATAEARDRAEAWRHRLLERSRARQRVGRATPADLAAAEAGLERARRERAAAVAAARQAEGDLNAAMGRPADTPVRLAGLPATPADPALADLTRLLRTAAERQPLLAQALSEVARRRAEAARTRAAGRPRVDAEAVYGWRSRTPEGGTTGEDDLWSLGLGLSWPLFTGFAQSRRDERDRTLAAQAAADHDDAVVTVAARIWRAWWQAHAAGAALEAARAEHASAGEDLRRVRGQLTVGAATATEHLAALAALAAAEEQVTATRGRLLLAGIRVRAAAGLDPRIPAPAPGDDTP